jgi:diguanylate cyclase (GGDEF)-like protein
MIKPGPASDHFAWLSGYLWVRGLSGWTRAMMAGISGAMALSLIALLIGEGAPRSPIAMALTWASFAGGLVGVAMWAWRWPSRRQSTAFTVIATASVAAACLAYPDPLAALLGCVAFSIIGGYAAFFHGIRLIGCIIVVSAAVAAVEAIRLASAGQPELALVDLAIVLQVNVAFPIAIHRLVRALMKDLAHADRDPLTGLLNRRAFKRQTLGLLTQRRLEDTHLCVAVIDLDRFKAVNDTFGHPAGDRALVDVARAIQVSAGDHAVVARSGGEEFFIAILSPGRSPNAFAQRVCDAIANLPASITASVGTATAVIGALEQDRYDHMVDDLVAHADTAMYQAKRLGGNRCHAHQGSTATLRDNEIRDLSA